MASKIIAVVFVLAVMVQISAALECGDNEEVNGEPSCACEPSCERPDVTDCIGCSGVDACKCKPGFVRLKQGFCGHLEDCVLH